MLTPQVDVRLWQAASLYQKKIKPKEFIVRDVLEGARVTGSAL